MFGRMKYLKINTTNNMCYIWTCIKILRKFLLWSGLKENKYMPQIRSQEKQFVGGFCIKNNKRAIK